MSRLHLFSVLCALVCATPLRTSAQWTTATVDGTINPGEYFASQTEGNTTLHLGWDNTNLYIAVGAGSFNLNNEALLFSLDFHNELPVNANNNSQGSRSGFDDWDNQWMYYPFNADFVLYIKNGYTGYTFSNGSGGWTGVNSPVPTVNASNGLVELSIPWNTITQGTGRPGTFNFTANRLFTNAGGNGIYHIFPNQTVTNFVDGNGNRKNFLSQYYHIPSTDNVAGNGPFDRRCLTFTNHYSEGFSPGSLNFSGTFYDVTVNSNTGAAGSMDGAARLQLNGDVTILNNLYIDGSGGLQPAPNSTPKLTFADGSNFYNFGFFYAVVDGSPNTSRRIDTECTCTVTFRPNAPLGRDRTRFHNLTVLPGATLQADAAGVMECEFDNGLLLNEGTLNLGDGTGGEINVGVRQDRVLYLQQGTGADPLNFHRFIVGNESELLPWPGSGITEVQVFEDLEVYGQLVSAPDPGDGLVFRFVGSEDQELKFSGIETTNDLIEFDGLVLAKSGGDLEIKNVAIPNDVRILIQDSLVLRGGDLVTLDRDIADQRYLVVLDIFSGSIDISQATGNGANYSSYVEGPISWQIPGSYSGVVSIDFPLGQLGFYRLMQVEAVVNGTDDHLITGELFGFSPYDLNHDIPTGINNISDIRFWNVKFSDAVAVTDAQVTLHYGDNLNDDGVTNPEELRVVREVQGATNGEWQDLGPSMGGTTLPIGSVTSEPFNPSAAGYDFTLGNTTFGINPLPVTWLGFSGKPNNGYNLLTWETASELNNDFFTLERSTNGHNWQHVATVYGHGTTHQPSIYSAEDRNPRPGITYYRLWQTDFDGTLHAGPHVVSLAQAAADVRLYPNPASDRVRVFCEGCNPGTELSAIASDGRQHRISGDGQWFAVSNLAPGVYSLRLGDVHHRLVVSR